MPGPSPSPAAALTLIHSQLTFHPPLPTTSFAHQTALVTGSNTGLGYETAKLLVRLGARLVILAVRNVAKGEDAVKRIEQETGRTGCLRVEELDMASFASVREFVERLKQRERETGDGVDVAVLNAGVWPGSFERGPEGFEMTITVNVLSTFLLALLLTQQMRPKTTTTATTTPRLAIVSSALHKFATLSPLLKSPHENSSSTTTDKNTTPTTLWQPFTHPLPATAFDDRYNDSKLLVQMLLGPLARETQDTGVCVSSVAPGWCASDLHRAKGTGAKLVEKVLLRSAEEGARVIVDAVTLEKVEGRHGAYVDDCRVKKPASWIATTQCQELSAKLWTELKTIVLNDMRKVD